MTADHYAALGVPRGASADEVKHAYRRAVGKAHPDRPGGDAEKFYPIQRAYEVLTDERRRSEYDRTGKDARPDMDSERAETLRMVASLLLGMIDQLDPDVHDVVKAIKLKLHDAQRSTQNDILDFRRKIRLRERAIRRIKVVSTKINDLTGILEADVAEMERTIQRGEQVLDQVKTAIAFMNDYSYDASPDPADAFPYNLMLT